MVSAVRAVVPPPVGVEVSETASSRTVFVTYVPPVSASVVPAWSTESTANLLHRLSRLARGDLLVVTRAGYRPDAISELDGRGLAGVRFVDCDEDEASNIFAGQASEQLRGSAVFVFLPWASALLPVGAVDALVAAHRNSSAECSILSDVPREATPIVYGAIVAERALALVDDARGRTSKKQLDWPIRLVRAASAGSGSRGLVTLTAAELYGADARRMPVAVEMTSADAVRRFDEVCRESGVWFELDRPVRSRDDVRGMELLYAWRRRQEQERRSSRWAAHSPPKRLDRPRLLFVSQPVAYSGAEESLCQAIGGLDKRTYDLHAWIGLDGVFGERLRAAGAKTTILGRSFLKNNPENYCYLSRAMSEIRPDIVHFNAFSGLPAFVVAKLFGSKCVYHLRMCVVPPDLLDVMSHSDRVVAVSEFVKRKAVMAGVPEDIFDVVCDPLDLAKLHAVSPAQRAAAKANLGIPVEQPVVLMVARYERRKRHDLLITALARLAADGVPFKLVMVGESNGDFAYEADLERTIEGSGLRTRTLRLGFQHDILRVEQAADVAVLCSDNEPLGTFILESMALGIAVVVSEDSGLAEVVGGDGSRGLLCRNGDSEQLAAKLEDLLTDSSRRNAIGARGRAHCVEACGTRSISDLEAVYAGLLRR